MDATFWHQRWKNNEIGFHEQEANALLLKHFNALSVAKGERIFVPLCGKSLDIAWFLAQGYEVVGAELSEVALTQLFQEMGIEPQITDAGPLKRYQAAHVEIFAGDIFNLTRDTLGAVNAIYDRAALVALPDTVRSRYTRHLIDITENAAQLLITYEYDQTLMDGPPFSISAEEVNRHYNGPYQPSLLASTTVQSKLKGHPATEQVWYLKP